MLRPLVCLAVAASISSLAQAAPLYHLTDLGTLGGGFLGEAIAINNAGQIVGWSATIDGSTRATFFDPSGGGNNRDLGTLGGNSSRANAINDAGQIVGTAWTADGPFPRIPATLFDPSGGGNNRDLGTLGGNFGEARAINDAGQIVGGADTADGSTRATLFDPSGGGDNRDLGTLGGNFSVARAINNDGQIVGGALTADGTFHATLFDPSGGGNNRDLGTLGGNFSDARAINDAGQIVGTAQTVNAPDGLSGSLHVTLFDPSGEEANSDLGTLGFDISHVIFQAQAQAINDAGQIVAGLLLDDPIGAFLLEDGTFFNLNERIHPTDPLFGDVFLSDARDINNAGQILATGFFVETFSMTLAFLLTPMAVPEPLPLAMIAVGLTGLGLLARRRPVPPS